MKVKTGIKYFFVVTAIAVSFLNCAKMVAPEGGPVDKEPPKIIESQPENSTANFTGKKIILRFDEYFQTGNLSSVFNISPPLKSKPEFRIKGKSLLISFSDTLRDSITYTLNFGNGIADLNENNPMGNYQFIFSTGPVIDSMSATGTVLDAFTLQPVEGVFVMMHTELSDSAPKTQIPVYAEKTDKNGNFTLGNMKACQYQIFALKDANNNLKFDQANEKFGFLDTSITTGINITEKTDTLKDINKTDSVITTQVTERFPKNIKMLLFEEENKIQYMTNSDRPEKIKCVFQFNKPLDSSFSIRPLNLFPDTDWCYMERNAGNDTVTCWLKDTVIGNTDTLKLEVRYNKVNTKGINELVTDTLNLKVKPRVEIKGKTIPAPKLIIKNNISEGSLHDLNIPVTFVFNHPVLAYDTSNIKLFSVADSVETPVKYKLDHDTAAQRLITAYPGKYNLRVIWDETKSYRLKILPCAFSDIYDLSNDTVICNFKIQKKEYYGSLILKIKNVNSPVIVQWMDTKESVLEQRFITSDESIKYEFLKPFKYKFKVIYDDNNNGKWDTGKYSEKRQPEKVLYMKSEIDIRSNWDIEQEWEIE